jgi:hypothetical protein
VYGLMSEGGWKAVEIFVGQFDCRSQKHLHLTRGTSTLRKDKQEAGIGLQEIGVSLDELVRRHARQVIQQVVKLELVLVLKQHANVTTLSGKQAVVRNGYLPERDVLTSAGPVAVRVPKVRDRSGTGLKFNSNGDFALCQEVAARVGSVALVVPERHPDRRHG